MGWGWGEDYDLLIKIRVRISLLHRHRLYGLAGKNCSVIRAWSFPKVFPQSLCTPAIPSLNFAPRFLISLGSNLTVAEF